jgi:dethiobiotin synthetase
MAPPMAAEALGRPPFTIGELASELTWPDGVEVGLVEGAGGARSPLASDGDTVDLARALGADSIALVADAGLGTINAVRLSVPPLADVAPVTVLLNRFSETDDLHARNLEWLTVRAGLDVAVTIEGLADHVLLMRP